MTNLRRRLIICNITLIMQIALTACSSGVSTSVNESILRPQSPAPSVQSVLAPQGVLRVGVYLGSPTSLVIDPKTGMSYGVALELGQTLAKQLNVQVKVIKFARVAEVIESLKLGQVDMTFTNSTEARAKEVDFSAPMIQLELGVLVPSNSSINKFDDLNRSGVRLGVSQGSSSQGVLGQRLKNTQIVPVPSIKQVQQMLAADQLDAFATNKGILYGLAEQVHGVRVLKDSWGVENLAIAIPKGRDSGLQYLGAFAKQVQQNGQLIEMVKRAGLRGVVSAN